MIPLNGSRHKNTLTGRAIRIIKTPISRAVTEISSISNNHSGDIYCQIAVSFNQVGKSKCDEDQTKQKNRVESTVGKFYFIDKPDSELTEGVSYDSSEQELYK